MRNHLAVLQTGPLFHRTGFDMARFNRSDLEQLLSEIGSEWNEQDRRDWIAQIPEIRVITDVFPEHGEGQTVLDVGIERGFKAIPLVQGGFRLYGLDFDDGRIAQHSPDFYEPFGIEVQRCDVTRELIPFDDNTFDWAMLNGVIEHWFDSPHFALQELRRVLKPRGHLVVTTPNAANLRKRIWLLFGKYPYVSLKDMYGASHPHAFHHREHTMAELSWVLEENGYQVSTRRFRDAFHRANPNWLKRIYWGVTWVYPPFRDQLIVVGTKPVS